jgi:predicted PurR-regulated permease PerM
MLIASRPTGDATFIRRVLMAIALVALALSLWQLIDILLLVFGSVLIAVLLRFMAAELSRRTGLGMRWALAASVVTLVALVAAAVGFLGPLLAEQLSGLADRLGRDLTRLTEQLRLGTLGDLLKETSAVSTLGPWIGRLLAWGATTVTAVTSLILVVVGGFYIAADPDLYRRGLLALTPPAAQPSIAATLDDIGIALRRWLIGQLGAMVLVGTVSWLAFMALGLPSAAALGLVAGIAEFVPMIGPVAAAIPALLVAASMDWQTLLYTLVIVVLIQQLENDVVIPLIINRTVAIAPAVGLFAILALGVLLGPLGLLFGFPLAVVIDAVVRRLYIREALGEPVETARDKADATVDGA